jgi:hypothetical protein
MSQQRSHANMVSDLQRPKDSVPQQAPPQAAALHSSVNSQPGQQQTGTGSGMAFATRDGALALDTAPEASA